MLFDEQPETTKNAGSGTRTRMDKSPRDFRFYPTSPWGLDCIITFSRLRAWRFRWSGARRAVSEGSWNRALAGAGNLAGQVRDFPADCPHRRTVTGLQPAPAAGGLVAADTRGFQHIARFYVPRFRGRTHGGFADHLWCHSHRKSLAYTNFAIPAIFLVFPVPKKNQVTVENFKEPRRR